MWDWQRSVVLPIALDGFVRSMRREPVEEGRLGGVTWGMGRGAMPPRFEERS